MTWGSVMHSSLEEKCASGSCVCGPGGVVLWRKLCRDI